MCDGIFLYFFRSDLGLDSLLPADFDDLARRLWRDDDLWDKFYEYEAPHRPKKIYNLMALFLTATT